MGPWEGVDRGTYYELQFQRKPWLTPLLEAVSSLGSYPVLAGVVLLALVVLLVSGRYRSAIFLAAAALAGVVTAEILKLLVPRERPTDWPGPAEVLDSFPSAPALVSAVVYVGLARVLAPALGKVGRVLLLIGATLLAVAVGGSQLYLGHNFLSDVLAGWMAAAVLLFLIPEGGPPPRPASQPGGAARG